MFHFSQQDEITTFQVFTPPGCSHKVDRFRRVSGKYNISFTGRIDKLADFSPGILIHSGSFFRQRIDTAVNIGIVQPVI
jgi:hypothetical protein